MPLVTTSPERESAVDSCSRGGFATRPLYRGKLNLPGFVWPGRSLPMRSSPGRRSMMKTDVVVCFAGAFCCLSLTWFGLSACGHGNARTGKPVTVRLGGECEGLRQRWAGSRERPALVLVQAGDLTYASPAQREALLRHQPVALDYVSMAHGLGADGEGSSIPWSCKPSADGCEAGAVANESLCQLTFTPILPDDPHDPSQSVHFGNIRIGIKGTAKPASEGRNANVRDQETKVIELRGPGGCPEQIAITPYLFRDRSDLLAYQACLGAERSGARPAVP